MKIKIRSIQIIKPSKPTPENGRIFKLSFLDQLATSASINIIFYYNSRGDQVNISNRCSQLVKSLSEVLTLFYPLAGRVTEDGLEVDCNDQGVKYLETRVSMRLDDFFKQDPNNNSELVGGVPPDDQVTTMLVTVQVNVFDCGSLVIGVSASHKITDACNLVRFVNQWASVNRTKGMINDAFSPSFDNLDSLFPPRKLPSLDYSSMFNDPQSKIISKRFVFNGDTISKLRSKATSPSQRHSRVTLVTATIWKAIISIDQVKTGSLRNCLLAPAMNLRGKASSPISESSFGNVWAPYTIRFLQNEVEPKFVDLVTLIDDTTRNSITGVSKASGEEICTRTLACRAEAAEELNQNKFCLFTSWCSFPLYKADFGWGKPYWASPVVGISVEMVALMDDKHGDGIEAWVCLQEKDMYLFEQDHDILAFTS